MCVYVCIYIPGILSVPRVSSRLARVPAVSLSNIPQVKREEWYWCNTTLSCWANFPWATTALIQWVWVCVCLCVWMPNTKLRLIWLHLYAFDVNHDNCQLQGLPFGQNQHVSCVYTVKCQILYLLMNPLPSTLIQHSNCSLQTLGPFSAQIQNHVWQS